MSTTASKPRVVVADDSALMRRIVSNLLDRGGFDVVGAARNGDEALALCESERPDAMTLDLTMPGMGGIDVLRHLRHRGGSMLPVVVVSAFSPAHGARAVDALAEGAFELVPKPAGNGEMDAFEHSLIDKIRVATSNRRAVGASRRDAVSIDGSTDAPAPAPAGRPSFLSRNPGGSAGGHLTGSTSACGNGNGNGNGDSAVRPRPARRGVSRALVIATSTGGPRALASLMPRLPSPLGLGTMIVQHMPAGFTQSLAARLDRASKLSIREAHGGEGWDPSAALVAPGGRHLRLDGTGVAVLSDEDPLGGLRPRADLLIEDAAARWGDRLTLVVLTGMGSDGLRGAREVRRRGGRILVEAESTCTVYGMPRAIVEAGLANEILPLDQLPAAIAAEVCS